MNLTHSAQYSFSIVNHTIIIVIKVNVWDRVTGSAFHSRCWISEDPYHLCEQRPDQEDPRVFSINKISIESILASPNPDEPTPTINKDEHEFYLLGYVSIGDDSWTHLGMWSRTSLVEDKQVGIFKPVLTGPFELHVGKALNGTRADYYRSAAVHHNVM
jgi:hypothetical protein